MIEFCKAYKCSDGTTVGTLEDAQRHELELLFASPDRPEGGAIDEKAKQRAEAVMANAERIVDILTTKTTSRPRARKANKKKAPPAPA